MPTFVVDRRLTRSAPTLSDDPRPVWARFGERRPVHCFAVDVYLAAPYEADDPFRLGPPARCAVEIGSFVFEGDRATYWQEANGAVRLVLHGVRLEWGGQVLKLPDLTVWQEGTAEE